MRPSELERATVVHVELTPRAGLRVRILSMNSTMIERRQMQPKPARSRGQDDARRAERSEVLTPASTGIG